MDEDPELAAARARLERAYERLVRDLDAMRNRGEHRQARERVAALVAQLVIRGIQRYGV